MKGSEQNDKKEEAWYADALRMFSRLSIWVAAPVVLASLLGQWLDDKFGTKPWILLVCIFFAFNLTTIVLIKEAGREFKRIEKKEDKKNKK